MNKYTKLKILVAVPSHKRPDNVSTLTMFPEAVLFVEDSQIEEYKKNYPKTKIVNHPDDVKGLTPKLNWMMKWAKENKYDVMVKIDDDFKRAETFCPVRGEINAQELYNHFEVLAQMCIDSDTNLFTFLETNDTRKFSVAEPFRLFSGIRIGIYGVILNKEQYFDERFVLKQDIDFALQSMYNFGHFWVDNRYSFAYQRTMKTAGGCATYRNSETEKLSIQRLKDKWGDQMFGTSKNMGVGSMTINVKNPMYK